MTKLRPRPASLVAALLSTGLLLLSGCGSLLESNEPPMQSYILRTALADTVAGAPASGTVLPVLQVFRPQAVAGLDSDRIAVVRADRRFDGYAASRWSDSVPKLLESLVVESLSQTGRFRAVLADAGGFVPDYTLGLVVRRFEAQYRDGSGPPTIVVAFDATVGRRTDRALVGVFSVETSAAAAADRMTAVVAAFETATQAGLTELSARLQAALQNVETPEPSISR